MFLNQQTHFGWKKLIYKKNHHGLNYGGARARTSSCGGVSFYVYSVILIRRNQKRVRRWQHQYNKVKVFEVEARERKHNNRKLSPCEPKGLSQSLFFDFYIKMWSSTEHTKNMQRGFPGFVLSRRCAVQDFLDFDSW